MVLLAHPHLAVPNVLLVQNVAKIKLVSIKNVLTPALVPVA